MKLRVIERVESYVRAGGGGRVRAGVGAGGCARTAYYSMYASTCSYLYLLSSVGFASLSLCRLLNQINDLPSDSLSPRFVSIP